MAYTYDEIFAKDPSNPEVIAQEGTITIFDPADPTKAPVPIFDVSGVPLPNPITVSKEGMGPAFYSETLDRVGWFGGGFQNYLTSYEGMRAEAQAAKESALESASAAALAAEFAQAPTDAQVDSGIARADIPAQVAAVVPGLVETQVPTLVPDAVDEYIATDPTVAQNAADIAQSTAGIVLKSHAGAPQQVKHGWPYRFRNTAKQILGGIRADGVFEMFKGFGFGTATMRKVSGGRSGWAVRDSITGRLTEIVVGKDGNVPMWVLRRWFARMGVGTGPSQPLHLTVRPTPEAGEYSTPMAAMAAITDSSETKPYIIDIMPGLYQVMPGDPFTVKEHVHMRATVLGSAVIYMDMPDTSTNEEVEQASTVWLRDTATLENLDIWIRNGRYAVHSESNGVVRDYLHQTINCRIRNLGNQGIIDYRNAQVPPLSTSGLISGDPGWGYGASSGGVEIFENTTIESKSIVWAIHDREDWTAPSRHTIRSCRLTARDADSKIQVETLGSGVTSSLTITDSEVNALYVSHRDAPWISEKPENQVADHYQIEVSIAGMEPIGFRTTARGRAFRITSNSTGAVSTVRVSGTAADAIMGTVITRDGGGGLKGQAYGTLDVSGIDVGIDGNIDIANDLGKRLGDCTTTAKTLTVTVDGGTPQNVVLSADYTAMTRDNVLAAINAGLTGAVADTYLVTQGERYPDYPDRQRTTTNSGATGIPRFAAVKRGADGRSIELMGTADAVTTFAGVALEPILPGKIGRILTSGLLDTTASGLGTSHTYGLVTTLAVGAPLYLSNTVAGAFATTGTRQIGTGYGVAGWAKF